jgi:alkylation response protein AidB-like acyl-CoA dehydrogenase
MAQTLSDRRDVQFVLYEQLNIEELTKDNKYSDLNKKTFDMVLSEARALATKELLPTSAEGDRQGCRFENGDVKVPDVYHRAYELLREGEWFALSDDPEVGGQGLPSVIAGVVAELFQGANTCLALGMGLTHGAGKLIEIYGTDQQKKLYLKKLYSGEWSGTMALTEPEAGSEVGELTTSAKKQSDGTYLITGNKIFISQAESDLTDNIINPVLARVEGAPKGSAGISLFIVPKFWVNDDGSLGERNDYVCTGIEEKIGIHGSPTCSLTFGGNGKCRGFLLGKENHGLKEMFHMMNEARLFVAMQALGLSSTAYLYAVNYARDRFQGRHLTQLKNPGAKQIPIIEHPDIRRMLIWMKAQVEGLRSLNYYVGFLMDKIQLEATSEEEKAGLNDLIALLIPVCKGFTTETACNICLMAIQVYGGSGACREYPVEQLFRDVKIATIYEGTTGIQAMDMLGRKLGMRKGKVFKTFVDEINKVIKKAKTFEDIKGLAVELEAAMAAFEKTAVTLGHAAGSEKLLEAFAAATPFVDVFGEICVAWMLLWRAMVASPKLAGIFGDADETKKKEMVEKNKEAAFYSGQIHTAQYFIRSVIPTAVGRMNAISRLDSAVVDMSDAAFGGK